MSDKKRICPDPGCGSETDAELQFCGKCGLDLDGFFQLDRILDVRDKVREKRNADAKAEADKNKPKPRGLAGLTARKKQ